MKSIELKKLIKQAVKEAIQEELKDILLEAVRSPKTVIKESYQPPSPIGNPMSTPSNTPPLSSPPIDFRSKYADVLNETAMSFTSQDVNKFNPGVQDPVNANLGTGEVGMDQIMSLLNPVK